MSHRRTVVLALVAAFANAAEAHAQSLTTPIDGVWTYVNPGSHGQSFFMDGRYVHFATRTTQPLPAGPLPDSVRARIWTTLLLNAGTFEVADTLVTARQEYSKDPRAQAVTWRWSFTLKGDTMFYRVLSAAGQATSTGRAVRVRRP